MLRTLLTPSAGRARVEGCDVVDQRDEARRRIGVVFQETTVDGYLTAEQNLRLHAELYGVPRELADRRIAPGLALVGLTDRRAGPRPAVLRRHEAPPRDRARPAACPASAVPRRAHDRPDPQTRGSIWRSINALRGEHGTTVFLTTHYMDEADRCDRIALIDRGRVVAIDRPDALKAMVGHDRLEIATDGDEQGIVALRERVGVEGARVDSQLRLSVRKADLFVPRLFAELGVAIRAIRAMRVAAPSLDDVFMAYTGATIREAEGGSPG